ncbi:MAG: lasso peptide biosynthesis B2 protein [Sphingomonas sp.]
MNRRPRLAASRAMPTNPVPDMALAVVHGHAIFLDCALDRYFALSPVENDALLRMLADEQISDRARRALTAATGIEASAQSFRSLLAPHSMSALVNRPAADDRIGWAVRLSAVRHLIGARLLIGFGGLRAALVKVAHTKAVPVHSSAAMEDRRDRIVSAHDWLSGHATTHDACLLRSLALARHLRSAACPAQLVIAVRAEPFSAHCWVQSGDRLLNEEVDHAASFEPILIVR